jgi:membrane protein implicated in regulation of membrane protease activity
VTAIDITSIVSLTLVMIGASMITIELASGNSSLFDLFISGIALITGGVIGMISGSWLLAIIVAAICVAGYWLILRVYLHRWLKSNTVHHRSNADKLIGVKTKIIRESADGKNHFVKIAGEEWIIDVEAAAEVGQEVEIQSQHGTRLKAIIIK